MKPISKREKKMCIGKVQHKSELAAKSALESSLTSKSFKTKHLLATYKCPFCGFWHYGNNENNSEAKISFPFTDKNGVKHNTWIDYQEWKAYKEFNGRK